MWRSRCQSTRALTCSPATCGRQGGCCRTAASPRRRRGGHVGCESARGPWRRADRCWLGPRDGCSRRSPGGVLEVVQGCTGRRGAQLPVLSDVVAPALVAPAAGADSSEGGRGPARGDVVTAQAAAAELIARPQCGLSAFTSSPPALWQDGSLWTSSLGVLVADDLVAHIGRLRAAHAAFLASVDGVDGVERECALLDACKRSPTRDSPEQRRFGRAVLKLQAVQLRLCRFLVELEPHAVGSSGEPVRSRTSASASVPDRSSGPRDAGLDDGLVHTGGNTGVVAGAETRASSAADGVPDADHAAPITARFGIAESEAAAAGAAAEAGASSASDRSSGPVGAAVEHGAPQVLGDRRVVPVGEEPVRAGAVPPDRVPDEDNAVPLTVRVHEAVVTGVAGTRRALVRHFGEQAIPESAVDTALSGLRKRAKLKSVGRGKIVVVGSGASPGPADANSHGS